MVTFNLFPGPQPRVDYKVKLFDDGGLNRGYLGEVYRIVKYPDGALCYYKYNKLHREDGPAIQYPSGNTWWYLDGKMIPEPNI